LARSSARSKTRSRAATISARSSITSTNCISGRRPRSTSFRTVRSQDPEYGNAGRNGGEYYTPRPLIRAIVQVVGPKVGERIYDGAVGSAGFLCEAFEYLSNKPGLSTKDLKTLQERTFFGKEKKSLAYVIAIMNMILHGIEVRHC